MSSSPTLAPSLAPTAANVTVAPTTLLAASSSPTPYGIILDNVDCLQLYLNNLTLSRGVDGEGLVPSFTDFMSRQLSWNPVTGLHDDVFMYVYYTVLIIHMTAILHPLILMSYRFSVFGMEEAKMGFSYRKMVVWFSPIWVHLINLNFMMYIPFSGYIYVGFILHVLGIFAVVPISWSAMRLTDTKVERLVGRAPKCVNCALVVDFARRNQIPLDYVIKQTNEGTFSGKISLPSITMGNGLVAEAVVFHAAGTTYADTRIQLNEQIGKHWRVLPGFSELVADSGRDLKNVMIVGRDHKEKEAAVSDRARNNSDDKLQAPIDVTLAFRNRLVRSEPRFDHDYYLSDKKHRDCTFTLERGQSSLRRMYDMSLISFLHAIPGQPIRINEGKQFACSQFVEAVPYLMSGYRIRDHMSEKRRESMV